MLVTKKKNLSIYEIKASYHGKYLNDFYLLVAMHQKLTSSLRSLVGFFWVFFLFFLFCFVLFFWCIATHNLRLFLHWNLFLSFFESEEETNNSSKNATFFSLSLFLKFLHQSRVIAGPDGFFGTGSRQPVRPYTRRLSLGVQRLRVMW